MTETQESLKVAISKIVHNENNNQIVYATEYLGYLPFGLYHWISCNNKQYDTELPLEFTSEDLDQLEKNGFITKMDYWENPDDDLESKTTYQVNLTDNLKNKK